MGNEGGTDVGDVVPLTHRNSDGQLYLRTALAETQIRAALRLSADDIWRRAEASDKSDSEYLTEECLVYLIRHYHRGGQGGLVNHLAEVLLRRIGALARGHFRALPADLAEEGYSETVEQLFTRVLDLESDRGDFLQVRFWPALERLAVKAFQKQLLVHKRTQASVSISNTPGMIDEENENGDGQVFIFAAPGLITPSSEEAVVDAALIMDALGCLEEQMRSAFLLRYYFEWPIEDKDPNVQTISKMFQRDPRTIRNWLKKASDCLAQWRGEQR